MSQGPPDETHSDVPPSAGGGVGSQPLLRRNTHPTPAGGGGPSGPAPGAGVAQQGWYGNEYNPSNPAPTPSQPQNAQAYGGGPNQGGYPPYGNPQHPGESKTYKPEHNVWNMPPPHMGGGSPSGGVVHTAKLVAIACALAGIIHFAGKPSVSHGAGVLAPDPATSSSKVGKDGADNAATMAGALRTTGKDGEDAVDGASNNMMGQNGMMGNNMMMGQNGMMMQQPQMMQNGQMMMPQQNGMMGNNMMMGQNGMMQQQPQMMQNGQMMMPQQNGMMNGQMMQNGMMMPQQNGLVGNNMMMQGQNGMMMNPQGMTQTQQMDGTSTSTMEDDSSTATEGEATEEGSTSTAEGEATDGTSSTEVEASAAEGSSVEVGADGEVPAELSNIELAELSNFKDAWEPWEKTDVPVFFHIPKAGGSSVKDVIGTCHRFVMATEFGVSDGHADDEEVAIVYPGGGPEGQDRSPFVNVDTTTIAGIERAAKLGFADAGLADAVVTPFIYESNALFTPTAKGRLFTVFRHPIDRAISMFYYIQVADWEPTYAPELKDWTIEQYATSDKIENNWLVRQLTHKFEGDLEDYDLKLAMEVVRRKFLVGLMTEIDTTMTRCEQYFRWTYHVNPPNQERCRERLMGGGSNKNTKKKKVEEGSEAWNLLGLQNNYDLQLYEYIESLFKEQAQFVEGIPEDYRQLDATCCKCGPATYPPEGFTCPLAILNEDESGKDVKIFSRFTSGDAIKTKDGAEIKSSEHTAEQMEAGKADNYAADDKKDATAEAAAPAAEGETAAEETAEAAPVEEEPKD